MKAMLKRTLLFCVLCLGGAAGRAEVVTLRGSESDVEVTVSNGVVGDVWLCMGQSNMEMSMGFVREYTYQGILNFEEELKDANYPQSRFRPTTSMDPTGRWRMRPWINARNSIEVYVLFCVYRTLPR